MPVGRLVEASEGRLPVDIELVHKSRNRRLGEVANGIDQFLVSLFKGMLDALVQLLIAAGRFDGPNITAANDGSVGSVKVQSDVHLVESAKVKVLAESATEEHAGTRQRRRLTFIASGVRNVCVSWCYASMDCAEVEWVVPGGSGMGGQGEQLSASRVGSLLGGGITCVSRSSL